MCENPARKVCKEMKPVAGWGRHVSWLESNLPNLTSRTFLWGFTSQNICDMHLQEKSVTCVKSKVLVFEWMHIQGVLFKRPSKFLVPKIKTVFSQPWWTRSFVAPFPPPPSTLITGFKIQKKSQIISCALKYCMHCNLMRCTVIQSKWIELSALHWFCIRKWTS